MNSQQIHGPSIGKANTCWTVTIRPSTCLRCHTLKNNEDEQVNDTHINNCFNQTISEFVFCKRAATEVLKTTLIPLSSTPSSTSVTATDRLQTMNPRGLSHADCQVGGFSAVRTLPSKWENWFLAKVPDSMPSLHGKACFTCLSCLIFFIHHHTQLSGISATVSYIVYVLLSFSCVR